MSHNFVISNWQDEHFSNWITFDGLVDYNGRKTQSLGEITAVLKGEEMPSPLAVRILKPSSLLHPGTTINYMAVLKNGAEWVQPSQTRENLDFDWVLVKNDQYGNPLAIKNLGSGDNIDVIIPDNYENYEIMVSAKRTGGKYVSSHKTHLHTPLE